MSLPKTPLRRQLEKILYLPGTGFREAMSEKCRKGNQQQIRTMSWRPLKSLRKPWGNAKLFRPCEEASRSSPLLLRPCEFTLQISIAKLNMFCSAHKNESVKISTAISVTKIKRTVV